MGSAIIYPGSFDPVTYGHIDIIRRASKNYDTVYVSVLDNNKKSPLFTVEERVKMLNDVTKDFDNVIVETFRGLLIDYAKEKDVRMVLRGLRALTDFEYELHMAQTNYLISGGTLETVFLPTDLEYSYLSSTTVREIASFHGDVTKFVPESIAESLYKKFGY
ncbi:MAG: pantetheine-phosphate adenylyltransferase [Lachnospiraceae bacterium]|nr:pantetheine-phosphate adenylyltransferase [Lachnospiraceae bacterium]